MGSCVVALLCACHCLITALLRPLWPPLPPALAVPRGARTPTRLDGGIAAVLLAAAHGGGIVQVYDRLREASSMPAAAARAHLAADSPYRWCDADSTAALCAVGEAARVLEREHRGEGVQTIASSAWGRVWAITVTGGKSSTKLWGCHDITCGVASLAEDPLLLQPLLREAIAACARLQASAGGKGRYGRVALKLESASTSLFPVQQQQRQQQLPAAAATAGATAAHSTSAVRGTACAPATGMTRSDTAAAWRTNMAWAEALHLLLRDGAAPWSHAHAALSPALLRELKAAVLDAVAALESGANTSHWRPTDRRGFEVGVRGVPLAVWRALLSPALLHVVSSYLGCEPAVVSVEAMRVPARARRQRWHRDHGGGAGKTLLLVVSLEGTPVTTVVVAGSHVPASASAWSSAIASGCTATRAAPASASASAASGVTAAAPAMLLDNYAVHGGAASAATTATVTQIFISFEGCLDGCSRGVVEERERVCRQLGFTAHTAVPCADVVAAVAAGQWPGGGASSSRGGAGAGVGSHDDAGAVPSGGHARSRKRTRH